MVDIRVRPDQASDGEFGDDGDDDGCECSRVMILGIHVTLGTILIRSIVDDCAATKRIHDPKTDER